MLPQPERQTLATHWGTYRVRMEAGRPVALDPFEVDPDPSPIASAMLEARTAPARILRPAVRRSFLERGHAAGGEGRGGEPFVELGWDEALALVSGELDRVRSRHGNGAIYGGSYGWASAGRFHHAQSQVHRFLNTIGGYTRSVQNYSFAAASPKNAQVSSGGLSRHALREGILACRDQGAELVSISPIRDDTALEAGAHWWAPRPQSDVALMLGLCHTLLSEGLHDRDFLARCTTGFKEVEAYLIGAADGTPKTADWAAALCEIPADDIRALARRMAAKRTFIMMSWSLQRADHGEQPYWMAITLAAMLGQIGLPGGGFGFGYGSVNGIGNAAQEITWPSLAQGDNPVADFIPVARIADMLLDPGGAYDFNGERRSYPDIKLVYWAGGNPFHHHQDLNRLVRAWQRPQTIIVHEPWWTATARHADIALPVTTQLERNDIVCANRDLMLAASHKAVEPAGEARDDYAIFSGLAARLGVEEAFTEGRDEESWLRQLYGLARQRIAAANLDIPDFDSFWRQGVTLLPEPKVVKPLLADFRDDPQAHRLATPSGLIELFSERIAGFGYADCLGHAAWLPSQEWLGAPAAERFPLHLISNQPVTKLHSQYDHGSHARDSKIAGREPVRMHQQDAERRGLKDGDVVRIFNDRGACLAGLRVSDALRPGVVQLSTGAWFDPFEPGRPGTLDKHGNPNVLTPDRGTSRLGQGPSAHSCLVEIEAYRGPLPEITSHVPPAILPVGLKPAE